MLVLSRKVGEEIIINGNIRIQVVNTRGNKVRIGINAPPHVTVDRQEVHDRKQEEDLPEIIATAITHSAALVAL